MTNLPAPLRDPAPMLERALNEWGGHEDLWIFGYGSLIWRPDFDYAERRPAKVHGWHRALKMWSRINRGTPECPGLVFGMLSGGSCRGMVFRVDKAHARQVMINLWRKSPNHTGELPDQEYCRIFEQACGRYGTTRDYAQATYDELRRHGIHDRALARLIALAQKEA